MLWDDFTSKPLCPFERGITGLYLDMLTVNVRGYFRQIHKINSYRGYKQNSSLRGSPEMKERTVFTL